MWLLCFLYCYPGIFFSHAWEEEDVRRGKDVINTCCMYRWSQKYISGVAKNREFKRVYKEVVTFFSDRFFCVVHFSFIIVFFYIFCFCCSLSYIKLVSFYIHSHYRVSKGINKFMYKLAASSEALHKTKCYQMKVAPWKRNLLFVSTAGFLPASA